MNQRTKVKLVALLASAFSLILIILLFSVWRKGTLPVESLEKLSSLKSMEERGVPSFEIHTLDGIHSSLQNLKGKVVILNLWATWCGPCLDEIPSLIKLIESGKGNIQLVAISQDSDRSELDAFLKSFPKIKHKDIYLVWDKDHEISKLFGGERLPESYILDRNLKLVKKIIGSINWFSPDAQDFLRAM